MLTGGSDVFTGSICEVFMVEGGKTSRSEKGVKPVKSETEFTNNCKKLSAKHPNERRASLTFVLPGQYIHCFKQMMD